MVFFRRICSSRPGDGEQRGQSLAALTARGRGLDCLQPQRMAACLASKQTAYLSLPRKHGSERYAACFDEVVARAVRFSQPAVLSALLVIQLFGIVIPPPFPLKSTKRSAAAILGRSAPSLRFIVRFGIFCCRQDSLLCFT